MIILFNFNLRILRVRDVKVYCLYFLELKTIWIRDKWITQCPTLPGPAPSLCQQRVSAMFTCQKPTGGSECPPRKLSFVRVAVCSSKQSVSANNS